MQDTVSAGMEADLDRLQANLRQLKIQYDMFFVGSIPKPPLQLRTEVEAIIKRYAHASVKQYAFRFRFNSLVGHYNSLSELWNKTLRRSEEGDRNAPTTADRARSNGSGPAAETTIAGYMVQDPATEREQIKLLHAKYLEARKKAGEIEGTVSFEAFLRGVAAQAQRLREKNRCDKVELRIVVAGRKVQLKARPGR